MNLTELILIAVSLSMDAFAVAVTNGICTKENKIKEALLCGVVFGLFQGFMPSIGYAVGHRFSSAAERYDHFIVLILLGFIGINMIMENKNNEEKKNNKYKLSMGLLLVQGFATSVDALAVGISFVALNVSIQLPVIIILIITFLLSTAGFMLGKKAGDLIKNKAELVGGIVLIFIGLKIFAEHIFFS